MTTAQASATMTTHRIDFVDENDAWRLLLGLIKHIANTRGTDTNKHLNKVRARDREEWHLGLACNGFSQQRLTGTWLSYHQHTARNTATELLEATRVSQELDKLLNVFFGLVHTCDISEGCRNLVFAKELCFALPKTHGATTATATALHLAHKEHEHRENQQNREAGDQ